MVLVLEPPRNEPTGGLFIGIWELLQLLDFWEWDIIQLGVSFGGVSLGCHGAWPARNSLQGRSPSFYFSLGHVFVPV